MIKQCKMCKESKPIEQFTRCKANKDGYYSYCKICNSNKFKQHYAKNPEKYKQRSKKRTKDASRNFAYKRKYKIDIKRYEELSQKQNCVCAICNRKETTIDSRTGQIRNLAVDHCHTTGKVRGLLCGSCNKAIGLFNDNPSLCIAASEYLTIK